MYQEDDSRAIEALIEDDLQTNDLGLYLVVFLIAVGVCTFAGLQLGMSFGPMQLIPSMVIGMGAVGLVAMRVSKKREAHERAIRAGREAAADAERARQIKDLRRQRFEAGK